MTRFPSAAHLVSWAGLCPLRKGGGLVDAPGSGLVGVKGNSPF
jgi:transposase